MYAPVEVAIVGAGPYGLSLAAHLDGAGIQTRVFGRPMDSWRRHMPEGMLLKSDPFASNLSDPQDFYTLARFSEEQSIPYSESEPVRTRRFSVTTVSIFKSVGRLGWRKSKSVRLNGAATNLSYTLITAASWGLAASSSQSALVLSDTCPRSWARFQTGSYRTVSTTVISRFSRGLGSLSLAAAPQPLTWLVSCTRAGATSFWSAVAQI